MTKTAKRTPRSKDLIRAARNILETKEWTKRAFAKTEKGKICMNLGDSEAYSFCAVGALDLAKSELQASSKVYWNCREILCNLILNEYNVNTGLILYNDTIATSKEDIINLFNKALK